MLGEADKSKKTINVKLWREPSTANHGAGKLSIPQFYHGKKTVTTWLLRGVRPLILAWSELIFYIYVRKLWWIWFGRSFATLIALYWFRKNLLFNFHCSFWMVSTPREALILFLVWCQGIPANAAPFPLDIIHWSWTKLRQWFTFELFLFFLFVFHSQICRARKLLRA